MNYSTATIWTVFVVLGVGTYLIRFSFLGLIGDRKLPGWLLRHLRYAPHAVLPALVAPMVLWPNGADAGIQPERLAAAALAAAVGWRLKNTFLAIVAGGATFYLLRWLLI